MYRSTESRDVIPSESASASGSRCSTQKTPKQWSRYYDGPGENAGVLPEGVNFFPKTKNSSGGWEARLSGTQAWRGFPTKIEAYEYAGVNMTKCPIDGRDIPFGLSQIRVLINYLKNKHPGEFERLKRQSKGHIRNIYVYPDCYSVNRRFIHNKFPGVSFETKSELDNCLKFGSSLHPEIECRNGDNCHGFSSGACGYNHPSASWCNFEKSHTKRCKNGQCKFDHGRGRMKFIVNNFSESEPTTPKKKVQVKIPNAPKKLNNSFEALLDDSDDESCVKKLEPILEKEMEKLTVTEEPVSEKSVSEKPVTGVSDLEDDGFTRVGKKPSTKKPKDNSSQKKAPVKSSKPKSGLKKKAPVNISSLHEFPQTIGGNEKPVAFSWKERCDEIQRQNEEKALAAREAEAERVRLEEEERLRLEKEEEERLRLEKEEEEERIRKEKEEKQKLLDDQFKGLTFVKNKKSIDLDGDIPKKGSKKRSKSDSKKGQRVIIPLNY